MLVKLVLLYLLPIGRRKVRAYEAKRVFFCVIPLQRR